MAEFKEGDKVHVRGLDGPPLTVAAVQPGDHVLCHWFTGDGVYCCQAFHASALEAVPEEEPGKPKAGRHPHAAHAAPGHKPEVTK